MKELSPNHWMPENSLIVFLKTCNPCLELEYKITENIWVYIAAINAAI